MLMAERGQVMRMQHVTLLMVERGDVDVYAMHLQVFEPLRLRCHSVHITKNMKKNEYMHYDERYTEFIEMT